VSHRVEVGLGDRAYAVEVGTDLEALLGSMPADLLARARAVVVDATVRGCQGDRIDRIAAGAGGAPVLEVPGGEAAKSLQHLGGLLEELLELGLDRSAVLVAVGGGATTDLAGFAAATLLRGIDWVAIPTTLLAMVDASVGGKTGINHAGAKNVVGAFHQPRAVAVDVGFLATLDPRELRSGMAEVVKAGAIADRALFDAVAGAPARWSDPDDPGWPELVADAIAIKARVVADDERESGRRAILNFGHTVGHALEAATGFGRFTHGEAVSVGMVAAARLSARELGLSGSEVEALADCLGALGLPVRAAGVGPVDVVRWFDRDKKRAGGVPRFVLTPRLGSASFGHRISESIVTEELEAILGGPAG